MADDDILDDLTFADEDKLRHEIKYLRERLTNLEGFKRMFFTLQADLVAEREKLAAYENKTNDEQDNSPTEGSEVGRLQNELQNATEIAMLSMTTTGEYGAVLDFFKKSGAVESYQELADLVMLTAASYGLSSAVQFRCVKGDLNFCKDDSNKKKYSELIARFKIKGRLAEEGSVACINYENISFISNNFPVDDMDKNGRLKDYLVILCSGVDERVKALDNQSILENQKKNLHKIVKATHNAISKIEKGVGNQGYKINELYSAFEKKLSQSIEDAGIPEQSKNALMNILKVNKTKLNAVLAQGLTRDKHFVSIISKLEKAYEAEEEQNKNHTEDKDVVDLVNES